MFKSKKLVNGVVINTTVKEIVDRNILEFEVGTTGFKGGDTGHGGRTYFRMTDFCSTDLKVNGEESYEVIIELGGDAELRTFIKGLEFVLSVLNKNKGEEVI